ncbi:MAG: T9SS type A sorting domain-containing protein, partial [Candidatus Azobacteroides sp.]|nr:T9SS type A sorting domain-containing protein [Candidatus Azobacteroides sp.]
HQKAPQVSICKAAGGIRVQAPGEEVREVAVYDIQGRLLKIGEGVNQPSAYVAFDRQGIFLVKVKTDRQTVVRKIVL